MRGRTHHPLQAAAATLAALVLCVSAASAWSGCKEDDEDSGADPSTVETYGAEVTVTVVGRGRVTAQPKGIDCPGTCFARIAFVPGEIDAAVTGISLAIEPGTFAHFVRWTFEAIPTPIKSSGPDSCSPMKRTSIIPAGIDPLAYAITLPLGEVAAEPPVGREKECATFARTASSYVATATFADDGEDSGILDASVPPAFSTPVSGVEAREVGVTGGIVYWRYQTLGDNRSGIAAANTGGGSARVVVDANEAITSFDVDAHVVYQRGGQSSLWVIPSGSFTPTSPIQLQSAPFCDAVASHATNVYCRVPSGGAQHYIYQWAASGGSANYLYAVPRGFDLAVDDTALYFSEESGGGPGAALIRSGSRISGGGPIGTIVIGQTTPRDLRVQSGYLFWLDGAPTTTGLRSARAAVANGMTARELVVIPGARLIATDPDVPGRLWAGVYTEGQGFSIVHADAATTGSATSPLRSRLPRLNGLAVDSAWVYWTQGDGGVHRALKPAF